MCRDPRRAGRLAAAALLWPALVLAGYSCGLRAGQREGESVRIAGVVSRVEAARVVIHTAEGADVTLTPLEDFTKTLSAGSKVTAWYYLQGGVKILERLGSAADEASPPPALTAMSPPAAAGPTNIRKLILLPNSGVADADMVFDAIEKYLHSSFGWYVAPRVLAEEIRRRSVRKSLSTIEAVNPETGEFDMSRYLGGQENLTTKLASETRVDAVLEASLEEVTAKMNRMVASWDGVEEVVGGKGTRAMARFSIVPAKGQVAATTVVLKLWDAQGNLLWSNRRGLAALGVQEGMSGKFRYRPLAEYVQNSEAVDKWLAATFASLLPAASGQSVARKPE